MFLSLPRRLRQLSIRAALALKTAVALALSAYFQWSWPIEIESWCVLSVAEDSPAEIEKALVSEEISSFKDLLPETLIDNSIRGYSGSDRPTAVYGNDGCGKFPRPLWAKQRSYARYHSRERREKHGPTQLYYSDDSLFGTEYWSAGRLHGEYTRHYPNGRRLTAGRFVRGAYHGEWTIWDAAGNTLVQAKFEAGKPIGEWKQYCPVRLFPYVNFREDMLGVIYSRNFDTSDKFTEKFAIAPGGEIGKVPLANPDEWPFDDLSAKEN